jgi:hypothetical protein
MFEWFGIFPRQIPTEETKATKIEVQGKLFYHWLDSREAPINMG